MSDEEREAIKDFIVSNNLSLIGDGTCINSRYTIGPILNLIEEQSKEIEEYKKKLDLDNECEIALNNKVMDLEKENEKLNKLHVQDNKHLDFIMKHSVPVQKIKDKIEELDYKDIGNFERRCKQEVLQSLLEKEEI